MLRSILIILLPPGVLLLIWMALARPPARAEFVLAIEEPPTLDPQRVSWAIEIQLTNLMFEGLTRLNPKTLAPEPAVAERWDFDATRNEYTFHLRREARWSDNSPVRASDFRDAWLRVLDAASSPQYRTLLFAIDGAEAYSRSQTRAGETPLDARTVGIEAPDDSTLCVRLARPCTYFLELTAFPTFYPLHPATLAKIAAVRTDSRPLIWLRPGEFCSNGAFEMSAWEFKRRIRFERNARYWDASNVTLRSIEASISADPNTQLIAYETGAADLVRTITTPVARTLREKAARGARPDYHSGERFATFIFRVNCTRPPLDRAEVRRALSLALDRDALASRVMGCGEQPAMTLIPRGALALMPRTASDGRTVCYEPPAGLGADQSLDQRRELARSLLKQADFPSNRVIELAYASDNADYRRVCEAIKEMWEQNLGITVALTPIEAKVLRERIRTLDYDLARSEWFGDYLDPSTFLDLFVSDSQQNRTGWRSKRYDELIAAAENEPDVSKQFRLFRDAERLLCEDELPIIPLFFKTGSFLLNPKFNGIFDNPRDLLPIQRLQKH